MLIVQEKYGDDLGDDSSDSTSEEEDDDAEVSVLPW